MTQSHGTKSHMLVSKLHSGTSKTKAGALFWMSHCGACSPACVILYHVTGSCKGPITILCCMLHMISGIKMFAEICRRPKLLFAMFLLDVTK